MSQMTAEQAAEWGKTLNFEKVWAMFAETDRAVAEAGRIVAETSKRLDNVSRNAGGINRSLGELIETLIAARLWEKFPDYGLVCSYQRVPIYDNTNRLRTDIDILLSNTGKAMAVEVKSGLDKESYVDEHLKRMELIRAYPPLEVVNKELFGTMAGGVVNPDVMRYAYDAGFYVLELTGDTVSLIPPPEDFKPGTW